MVKHYKKPKHEMLDKEDENLLDKKGILKLDKKIEQDESFLKRLFSFGKKKK